MADGSYFIVIEGIDGAGKTSIAQRLYAVLRQTSGDAVLLTEEPHDDSLMGREIRDALRLKLELSPSEIALAFALNRSHHLRTVIDPHLNAKGRIVICDRYILSSLVYQARGAISMQDILRMNLFVHAPDLTLVLQVSATEAYQRMKRSRPALELFENDLPTRLQRYQDGIALLRDNGQEIIEVDGNGSPATVFTRVMAALKWSKPDWLQLQPPLL